MNYQTGENTRDSQVGTNIQGYILSVHQTKVVKEMRTSSILGQIDERKESSLVDDGAASSQYSDLDLAMVKRARLYHEPSGQLKTDLSGGAEFHKIKRKLKELSGLDDEDDDVIDKYKAN